MFRRLVTRSQCCARYVATEIGAGLVDKCLSQWNFQIVTISRWDLFMPSCHSVTFMWKTKYHQQLFHMANDLPIIWKQTNIYYHIIYYSIFLSLSVPIQCTSMQGMLDDGPQMCFLFCILHAYLTIIHTPDPKKINQRNDLYCDIHFWFATGSSDTCISVL